MLYAAIWAFIKPLCNPITHLQDHVEERLERHIKCSNFLPQNHVIENLIHEKCIVNGKLNKIINKTLIDAGVQVSLLSKSLLRPHPDLIIKWVHNLLHESNRAVKSGKSSKTVGYVDMTLQLKHQSCPLIQALNLVASYEMKTPKVGFNVLKELLISSQDESLFTNILKSSVYICLKSSFTDSKGKPDE